MRTWRNWARNQQCAPARIERPASEQQLVDAVVTARAEGRRLRVVGSGHSFTPVVPTDGVLVDLTSHAGLVGVDGDLVTVQAGMPLRRLNAGLAARGLAMPNLGDIDYQTVAGAISTGTHGTGATLGGLSTTVAGLRLVLADGSTVDCSEHENPALWSAARVGLGALGVISTVTLRVTPAFTLHAVEETVEVDGVLSRLDELIDGNDHFEFYWFPGTGTAQTKRNNRVPGPARPRPRAAAFLNDVVLANGVFGAVCRASAAWPPASGALRAIVPHLGGSEHVDVSHRVFTSPRLVRFVEMEYAMPRAAFGEVFEQVRRIADRLASHVVFPIECRWAAADDIPLSTASGRDTAYLAVHVVRGNDPEPYFREVERVLDGVGGRPHWGKVHFQDAASLAPRYPRWDEFQAARAVADPTGVFLNPHVERVLGPAAGERAED